MTTPTNLPRLAVFIDAENVGNPSHLDLVFDKIASARLGTPVVKRVYGNPTLLQEKKWMDARSRHQIKAVPQKHFVRRKNSADVKIVVDAMQALYDKGDSEVDVFCFVSSDTDFRPLVEFISTKKRKVLGFGKGSTSEALKEVFGERFCSFEELLETRYGTIRDESAAILEDSDTHSLGYASLSGLLRKQLGKQFIPIGFSPKAVLKDDPRFDVEHDANRVVLRMAFVRASRYLDNLKRNTKPGKAARLRASVSNFFLNRLTETEVDAILSELEKAGVHAVGGRLVYPGETKRND